MKDSHCLRCNQWIIVRFLSKGKFWTPGYIFLVKVKNILLYILYAVELRCNVGELWLGMLNVHLRLRTTGMPARLNQTSIINQLLQNEYRIWKKIKFNIPSYDLDSFKMS